MTKTKKESDFIIGNNIGLDVFNTLEKKGASSPEAVAGILSVVMRRLYAMPSPPSEKITIMKKEAVITWLSEIIKAEGKE